MRNLTSRGFQQVRKTPPRPEWEQLLPWEDQILARLGRLLTFKSTAMRTRHPGPYHLGRALHTVKDFAILDLPERAGHELGPELNNRPGRRGVPAGGPPAPGGDAGGARRPCR